MSADRPALRHRMLQFIRREMNAPRLRLARGVLILVLVAAAVYWGYGEHKKRELPKTVSALVRDASMRLHDALSVEADTDPATAQRIDQHAIAVDHHLRRLREMDTAAIEEFAGTADDYLLTSREILRRRAWDYRLRAQLTESTQALRQHMRTDNRTGAWVSQAVRAKERVEAEYREYRLTMDALEKLLGLFPASRARLTPHVDSALLADEGVVAAARVQTLETFRKITDEVERTGQLNAYR